jgi:hypothetical protein
MVDVPYFGFIDYNENAQGGFQYASGQNETVLNYVSWSDTQIVISGMQGGWLVPKAGDAVGVEVWNANSCIWSSGASQTGNSSLTAAWAGTLR